MRSEYMEKTYSYGIIATIIAIGIMLIIWAVVCTVYGVWHRLSLAASVAGPLLALYVPIALAEQLSMIPIAGTTAYLNSIMGNVMNIKFPCYLSAIDSVDANPGTEMADVMGMIAITVAGLVTIIVVAAAVFLLVPLEPVLTSDTVTTAINYIMPALYGSMGISAFIGTSAGKYNAPRRPLVAVIALAIVFGYSFIKGPIENTGYAMLIMLVVTVLISYVLYKQGILKLYKKEEN